MTPPTRKAAGTETIAGLQPSHPSSRPRTPASFTSPKPSPAPPGETRQHEIAHKEHQPGQDGPQQRTPVTRHPGGHDQEHEGDRVGRQHDQVGQPVHVDVDEGERPADGTQIEVCREQGPLRVVPETKRQAPPDQCYSDDEPPGVTGQGLVPFLRASVARVSQHPGQPGAHACAKDRQQGDRPPGGGARREHECHSDSMATSPAARICSTGASSPVIRCTCSAP